MHATWVQLPGTDPCIADEARSIDDTVDMERIRAETRAMLDQMDRIARNHPDWGFYLNPEDRPKLPWWRRLLKL